MALTREDLVYLSKIADSIERYDDVFEFMKKVVLTGKELSVEERNILSLAKTISIESRRNSWTVLTSIEKKEEAENSKYLNLVRDYKKKVVSELTNISNEIIYLIDDHLIKSSENPETKVFFLKMKADHSRKIIEWATEETHQKALENAASAYKLAFEFASQELETTHLTRLGLSLNYSMFLYEVLNDPKKACSLAKKAFDDAIAELENVDVDHIRDVTCVLQVIRDSTFNLWTSEIQENEEGDGNNAGKM